MKRPDIFRGEAQILGKNAVLFLVFPSHKHKRSLHLIFYDLVYFRRMGYYFFMLKVYYFKEGSVILAYLRIP